MKIAFVVDHFPALSHTFVQNQITGLIDLGHDIDIFAQKARDESKVHPGVDKYNLPDNTYYWEVPSSYLTRALNAARFFINSSSYKRTSLLRSLNPFLLRRKALSLRSFYQVLAFIQHGNYDIIQCHFGGMGNLGLLMKELGAVNGSLVTSFHGFDLSSQLQKVKHNPYEKLFKEGSLFLPISDLWRHKLIELGCGAEKIRVHKMGVDLDDFKFVPRKRFEDPQVKVLSVSRLTEKKGIRYAIEAIAKLAKNYPNIHYSIVGDGVLRESLLNLIGELNVQKNVELLGVKKKDEVVALIEASDIFIAPSVTSSTGDKEGIPVSIMEALAVGIPVISTFHSGIPELIEDGKTGLLASEKNSGELAEKIRHLIENKEFALQMAAKGRKFVEETHDIRKLNVKLVDLYESVL